MQVRKFEATSMRDALSAVKRELGVNAVILSTKEVAATDKGMPKLFEVTAAASVSSKAGAEAKARPQDAESTSGFSPVSEVSARIAALGETLATSRQARLIEGGIHDVKALLLDLLREQKTGVNVPPHLFAIDRTLLAAGVDPAIIAELGRHLASLPAPAEIVKIAGDGIEKYYQDLAMRWLMKRLKIAPKWTNVAGMTNVHVILGTPGAGKSTLVSKIATAVTKKDRHRVAILSWDSEKLGASEQTRIYSKILGVEHYTISRAEELKPAIMRLRDVDLLLVDTAGRNPVDTSSLVALELIKNQGLSLEFHLVLSATEKQSLQDRTIRHFSTIGISSVAFTKLDEVPAWGDIFNASCKWSMPVSWLSWSHMPSDIPERASREAIVDQLFKVSNVS
jgi:flagellar biosynthesis protein FlhF